MTQKSRPQFGAGGEGAFLPNLWGKETELSILSNAWPDSPLASREKISDRSITLAPGHGRHTAVGGEKPLFFVAQLPG